MVDWDEMSEREKDEAIALSVMGWTATEHGNLFDPEVEQPKEPWRHIYSIPPHYTTDISAAWQVVEKMRADGWDISIKSVRFNEESEWRILFYGGPTYDVDDDETWSSDLADGICKDAYLTVRNQQMRELAHEIADRNGGAMRRLAEED